jgi:hypothetical protein
MTTSVLVAGVCGQAASTFATTSLIAASANPASKPRVVRTSTFSSHRSGFTEKPSPPCTAVTVIFPGSGNASPVSGIGGVIAFRAVMIPAAFTIAFGALFDEPECPD